MIPNVTPELFGRSPHLIHEAVDRHAAERPDDLAIINATRGTRATWAELSQASKALAAELQRMGLRKGDFFATSLPLLTEHIILEYACFRLGVIHAPLDLRLSPAEVMRCLGLIRPKAYAFPPKTPFADFAALGEAVRANCPYIEHFVQFSAPADCIAGAESFAAVMSRAGGEFTADIVETDGAQVIFTTGSTGSPKPALLSHVGITCQNLGLGSAFHFGPGQRVLCNLPSSHVGGQAELLMTSLYMGGTAVVLEIFDAVKSLDAVEQHGVTLIGQIPAMFQMEWRTDGYVRRNLSSLRAAVYGGQSVPRSFLDAMLKMAPNIGTGLGLTEASGFCTYTECTPDADLVDRSLGFAMPVYPMTIRREMTHDGLAGAEVPEGELGHVCFRGPQTFLGYVNDPEATARAISKDGWLYTGDMGFVNEAGLHFAGRAKWVLKPAGYQVFPGDIENHIARLPQVGNVGVVGHQHGIWGEGVIAFVEKRAGTELTDVELKKHARSLTSYMRPLHYVILEPGTMPLNRTAKVDVVKLQEMARDEVAHLRGRGRWDARGAAETAEAEA